MQGQRIEKVKQQLERLRINSFLISNAANIRYLTGFACPAWERVCYCIVRPDRQTLIVPQMYRAEAEKIANSKLELAVLPVKTRLLKTASKLLQGKVGFEAADLKYAEFTVLKTKHPTLQPLTNLIENLRLVKDKNEIQTIKKAAQLTDKLFRTILAELKPGQTELAIAQRIKALSVEYGGEDIAFSPIVAYGKNSALPHYKTGRVKLRKQGILLLDFGIKYNGYCSDLTRTVVLGRPGYKLQKIYTAIRQAQQKAIDKIKPGIQAAAVHHAAVKSLRQARLANYCLHGIGHGVGLNIHEAPVLGEKANKPLREAMVLTIEPGVYIQNWGGIRIEDIILITTDGHEILSRAPKELIRI